MDDELGDQEFQDFINSNRNNNDKDDLPSFLLIGIREKLRSLSELYKNSIDFYLKLETEDALKNPIKYFIRHLIKNSNETIKQFDYLLIDSAIGDDEDDVERNN